MPLLPDDVDVNSTIDEIGLRSNLTTNKKIQFTEKTFLFTMLGFTISNSGAPADIEGFVQIIPGTYETDLPINITGIDKPILKYVCINRSFNNGIRACILFSTALDKPPGHEIYKKHRIKFSKRLINLFCLTSHFIWKMMSTNWSFLTEKLHKT